MALVHRVGWDPAFLSRSPWFWPLAGAAARFAGHTDWPHASDYDALYEDYAVSRGAPKLRFAENVRKEDKRAGGRIVLEALYDGRIARGEVPTRERDWHDFFNALCFATFPFAKHALHTRQFAALTERVPADATRLPNARTPEQDALTLFDEGGVAVVITRDAHERVASATDAERGALIATLTAEDRARVVPFGHALYEHLVEGLRCPGGCSQLFALDDTASFASGREGTLLAWLDTQLAARLADRASLRTPRECRQYHFSGI